jgi:hypothetical protein
MRLITMVLVARLIDCRAVLTIVKPDTSFGGIAKGSGCFGDGSRRRAVGRRSRATFNG